METPNTRRGQLRVFARRLYDEMELRKISINELAKKCSVANGELQELNAQGEYKKDSYDWSSKIKDIRQATSLTPKSGCAKELFIEEREVICRALNRPLEYMENDSWNRKPIYLDPLFDDGTAEFIGYLIGKAEESAKVLTGWAEFLPCSLETPEFMHHHHRSLHKSNLHDEEQRANSLADRYDRIGNFRRAKFEDRNRGYDFEHLMFRSHLLNIADGKREYVSISKRLREECLRNLAKMVLKENLRLRVFIAPDEKCETLKEDMRGNDSMLVFGRHFTLWRNHFGDILWNENEFWINRHAKWADEFKSHSISNPTEVADALNELADRTKRK